MTRDALELREFLAEVLVERRQDPDAIVLVVLELKRGRGYVREVRVSKGREKVHEVDRKGSRLTENRRRPCLATTARQLLFLEQPGGGSLGFGERRERAERGFYGRDILDEGQGNQSKIEGGFGGDLPGARPCSSPTPGRDDRWAPASAMGKGVRGYHFGRGEDGPRATFGSRPDSAPGAFSPFIFSFLFLFYFLLIFGLKNFYKTSVLNLANF
jgi:hypothetical protein